MNANLQDTSLTVQRIDWNTLDAPARTQTLERPAQTVATETRRTVAALIDEVRSGGLDALRAITQRFDGAAPASFEVGEAEFAAAQAAIDPALKQAMVDAAARIETFHRAGMAQPYAVETAANASSGQSAASACTCRPAARRCHRRR
jgi:histidinol dehydrogenase